MINSRKQFFSGYSVSLFHAFFKIYCFAEQELLPGNIIHTNYDTSLVSGMCLLKEACYMTTWVLAIRLFYCSSIISWEHFKQADVKPTVFISQHLLQPSIVNGWFVKIWRIFLFEESHCGHAVLKVPMYSKDLYPVIFVGKVLCWMHESTCSHPFYCANSTTSQEQEQLQLFINYSKFFRLTIVDICSCKSDFRNNHFLRKSCSFGVLIPLIFFRDSVVFGNSYCWEDLFEA